MVSKFFRLYAFSYSEETHLGFNVFNVMTIEIWFISEIPVCKIKKKKRKEIPICPPKWYLGRDRRP